MSEKRTFRYGWPWMAIGILLMFLSAAFPTLMRWNGKRMDAIVIAFFAAMAAAGIYFLAYFLVFRMTISENGMTIRSLFREQTFMWSEVTAIRSDSRATRFEFTDRRRFVVSSLFPDLEGVIVTAGRYRRESMRKTQLEAVSRLRQSNDRVSLAQALRDLGELERSVPETDGGVAAYREAVEILRADERGLKLAHTVRHLGDIYRHAEKLDDAEQCYAEALQIYRAHPEVSPLELANALRGTAFLKEKMAQRDAAAALWREARTLYEAAGIAAGVEEASRRVKFLTVE
jgi:tetratricopeptide (TPR) repeat protein